MSLCSSSRESPMDRRVRAGRSVRERFVKVFHKNHTFALRVGVSWAQSICAKYILIQIYQAVIVAMLEERSSGFVQTRMWQQYLQYIISYIWQRRTLHIYILFLEGKHYELWRQCGTFGAHELRFRLCRNVVNERSQFYTGSHICVMSGSFSSAKS